MLLFINTSLTSLFLSPAFANESDGNETSKLSIFTKNTVRADEPLPDPEGELFFNYSRLDIESLSHLAQIITFFAILIGGIWAFYNFTRSRRLKAAEWVHDLFQQFQLKEEFSKGKLYIRYEYSEIAEPVLAKMIIHGDNSLKKNHKEDKDQRTQALQIDRALNILEHVLYLKSEKHITEGECDTYFGFWFRLINRSNMGILRRYLVNFNYNLLAKYTKCSNDEYIVFYGTQLSEEQAYRDLNFDENLEFLGDCKINGKLYDFGKFPNIVLCTDNETDVVTAELYLLKNKDFFREIDKNKMKHGFTPTTTQVSQYKSKCKQEVRLNPPVDAWIYTNKLQQTEDAALIQSGSWKKRQRS
jgi:gamma-glutamylcyclotransferase (GGCT)/AIG2-like uncharacterized protein YtfP